MAAQRGTRPTRSLVIVESPAKARTISGFLGKEYKVLASFGHVRDLPKKEKEVPRDYRGTYGRLAGVSPEHDFSALYIVPDDKREVIQTLREALRQADELILATDEDREGEAISWHIQEVLQPRVPVRRMVFHEITPKAIQHALQNPRTLDMKLVAAQEGRRILDRLVGYEVSPVLWSKIGKFARSAGRVQSVAVRLLVERERARMSFRQGTWYSIEGTFSTSTAPSPFEASLVQIDGRRVADSRDIDPDTGAVDPSAQVAQLDGSMAQSLLDRLQGASFRVSEVERNPFQEKPKAPFTTSTLQQESARKLGLPPVKTMGVAQSLYEKGYITYMRTDSTNLSEQALTAAREAIGDLFGNKYLPPAPRTYKSKVKNAQEAHEAIRPAGAHIRTPDEVRSHLDRDEARLYELIWMRTLASQMANATGHNTVVWVSAQSSAGEQVLFRGSGRAYDFPGYRRAYVESEDDAEAQKEGSLPAGISEGPAQAQALEAIEHETQPPPRYTEARLIRELEELGIGRPSTFAATIQTIQNREYAWKKGNALVPTWTAFLVIQLLEDHFGHLVDYGFTAGMEEDLDSIARGERDATQWLRAFYFGEGNQHPGLRDLVSRERLDRIRDDQVGALLLGEDPQGNQVIIQSGQFGPVVHIAGREAEIPQGVAPDEFTVDVASSLEQRAVQGVRVLGVDPASGRKVFLLGGQYGPYVQLGPSGGPDKPKRASLLSFMLPDNLTLAEALNLLSLPRLVGRDRGGRDIIARQGKFGAYLQRSDGETRNLPREDLLFTIGLGDAEQLFSQPKNRGRYVSR